MMEEGYIRSFSNNILFIGAGRRFDLAELFKSRGFSLHFYELSKNVPVFDIADEVFVGKHFSSNKTDAIKDIVNLDLKYKYRYIFPCFDDAVLNLIHASLALPSLIISRNDGVLFACMKDSFNFLMEQYFPEIFPKVEEGYPAIAKPKMGYGSKGTFIISPENLSIFLDNNLRGYVLQKYISGDEYSVDCYFSKESSLIDGIPRRRLRVSGGEVLSSITVKNQLLLDYCSKIGFTFGFRGPINFQFIIDKDNNFFCIECNARFGGGFTFSMKAGLDVISLLESEYYYKKFSYIKDSWKEGLVLERSYRDHIFNYE
jgi:carbamoyl-phosphate synthase large subunit